MSRQARDSSLGPFERHLLVSTAELCLVLRGQRWVPWADFLVNPRRLRGSDFLMRWPQGVWSEERLVDAVNTTGSYFALPYGPSGVAPSDDIREFELYFERLEAAGLGDLKRPDLLLFRAEDRPSIAGAVEQLGGPSELPFVAETDGLMHTILARAFLAIECETSLWLARKMPGYGSELKPMRRLGGQPGLAKGAVVPTVILKQEDLRPLRDWQESRGIPVHIWHVFYDMAFGIAFSDAEELMGKGAVEPTQQVFQAPGGATTRKVIYKVTYHHAYRLGEAREEPQLVADSITDKNGHILPYVRFHAGRLRLSEEALQLLHRVSGRRDTD